MKPLTASADTDADDAIRRRADVRTISVVGVAHGSSHFFHLLLPPLFPFFQADFGLTYAEMGLLVSAFFAVSGTGQAVSGFLVDRWGARPALFGAMLAFMLAALATAAAQNGWWLLLAAVLAGAGNAVFHPADFAILNHRVHPRRLGHAYSTHGLSGNLGWALAPAWMTGLGAATGSWRGACLAAALLAIAVLLLLVSNRDVLESGRVAPAHAHSASRPEEHPLAFLRLPEIWGCFAFFFWSAAALGAIQSLASPALGRQYGLPLSDTALVVSGSMMFGAVGMLLGGFTVSRVARTERTIALALGASALLLAWVGSGQVPAAMAPWLVMLSGFGTGLAGPSRDMLIRRAAPAGATGRVYGTVYSGLDLGFALAAPLFGMLLDRQWPGGIFLGAAACLVIGLGAAHWVGARAQRARSPGFGTPSRA